MSEMQCRKPLPALARQYAVSGASIIRRIAENSAMSAPNSASSAASLNLLFKPICVDSRGYLADTLKSPPRMGSVPDFVLATYVPFDRFHEVLRWQLKNAERLGAGGVVAYVDGVFDEGQLEALRKAVGDAPVEIRHGLWRSRGGTWFSIMSHQITSEAAYVVVDSDNEVLDAYGLLEYVRWCGGAGHPICGVLDSTALAGDEVPEYIRRGTARFVRVNGLEVGLYRIVRPLLRGNPLFIGPKQVVVLNLPPSWEGIVERVGRAFFSVNPSLRQYISDETVIAAVARAGGQRLAPYLVGGTYHHVRSGRTPYQFYRRLIARAHYEFAKALCREGMCFYRYLVRYLISNLYNGLTWLA